MRSRPAPILLVALAAAASPGAAADAGQPAGTIVFTSNRAATLVHPAVYTIGLDGRDRRRVTPAWDGISSPRWSPDGRWIAFLRNESLYVVRARGGRPRRVAKHVGLPQWSPDASRLAFLAQNNLMVARAGRWRRHRLAAQVSDGPAWSPDGRSIAFTRAGQLRAVGAAGGRERRIRTGGVPASAPAWSPDGARIAFGFAAPGDGIYDLYVVDLRTERARRIARGFAFPAWSPDGTMLAAKRSADTTRPGDVYVLAPDGSRRRWVADDDVDEAPHDPPVWSPGSTLLAVVVDELYVVRADGGGRRRITRERPRFDPPFAQEASWSPDGTRLAYVSELREPGDSDLYTVSASGRRLRALTTNWLDEQKAVWSPDGRRLALVRYRRGRPTSVALLRPGGRVRLFRPGRDPSWSPDGRQLAFERGGDIYVAGVEGGNERAVTTGLEFDSDPDWSPDGRRLVFARIPPGRVYYADLWTIGTDGAGLTRLTDVHRGRDECTVTHAYEPAWSPDGSEIAFTLLEGGSVACLLRGGITTIRAVSADGSGRTRLITDGGWSDPTGLEGGSHASWSPDGSYVAFVSDTEQRGTRVAIVPSSGGPFRFITGRGYAAYDPDWRPS